MLPNNQSFSIALLLEAIFRKNKDVSSVNWLILFYFKNRYTFNIAFLSYPWWLARKIFFRPISEEVHLGDSLTFLHAVVFFIDNGKILERVSEKSCNEAEEIASRNMSGKKQYFSIYFHGRRIEGISYFFIPDVHVFYTVVSGDAWS